MNRNKTSTRILLNDRQYCVLLLLVVTLLLLLSDHDTIICNSILMAGCVGRSVATSSSSGEQYCYSCVSPGVFNWIWLLLKLYWHTRSPRGTYLDLTWVQFSSVQFVHNNIHRLWCVDYLQPLVVSICIAVSFPHFRATFCFNGSMIGRRLSGRGWDKNNRLLIERSAESKKISWLKEFSTTRQTDRLIAFSPLLMTLWWGFNLINSVKTWSASPFLFSVWLLGEISLDSKWGVVEQS